MNEPSNRWNPEARPELEGEREPEVPGPNSKNIEETGSRAGASQRHGGFELNAIVGQGTAFQGTLSFSGKVRVDGEFEGTARGGELLVVGDGAQVRGEVYAQRVVVLGGVVTANITAEESIEIYIPAQVTGDLKSPQIYMDRGIQFQGTCDMTADPPSVEPRT